MLPETLKNKIIQHLSGTTGEADWKLIAPEIVARECVVYRFSSDHYATDMALKIYHDQQIERKTFMHYQALERYAPLLNTENSQYRIPTPHGCFAEDHCFLMEWIEGTSLEECLWRVCYHRTRLQAEITKAYNWLANYHQNAEPHKKKVDFSAYLNRLDTHIERYNGSHLLDKNPIFLEAYNTLNALAPKLSDFETIHANIHGDFTFSNILLGDDHVTAIDIGGFSSEPIENDMALMLNYLCITYFNMLTRGDMQKPPEAWPIFKVVFEAYDYPKNAEQIRFFLFVFLYQTLRRWVVINDRNLNQKTTWVEKWRLRNSVSISKGVSRALQSIWR